MARTTEQNRRYYLHSKIKQFTSIIPREKQIDMTEELMDELEEPQKKYLQELRSLGYSIQYTLLKNN